MFPRLALVAAFLTLAFFSCKKDDDTTPDPVTPATPRIYFTFKFDSTQARLDNLGNVSTVPANHGAQSPVFHFMSTHYIEMTPDMWTALGAGEEAGLAAAGAASTRVSQATPFPKWRSRKGLRTD